MIPLFVTMAIYYGESIQRHDPQEWMRFTAIIIFLVAAASDGLDGYIARRYKQRSSLGLILDPIADKGLLLSGIITLSISNWSQSDPDYGKFPAWFPVLVITRDAVPPGRHRDSPFFHRQQNESETKLDWKGRHGLPNVRDSLGHVANSFSSAHFCGRSCRRLYPCLGHHLCDVGRATITGGRARSRTLGLTSVPLRSNPDWH